MFDFTQVKTSPEDAAAIHEIATRAHHIAAGSGPFGRPLHITCMDLEVVHHKTPLDLAAMQAGCDADVVHDVFGIARHLNRETGQLEDCFAPRFTRP